MLNLQNMKIGARLSLGFGVVLALLVLLLGFSLRQMSVISDKLHEIAVINNDETALVSDMRNALNRTRIAIRDLALLTDAAEMKVVHEDMQKNLAAYNDAEAKLGKMFSSLPETTDKEKALFTTIQEAKAKGMPGIMKTAELGLANKGEEATKLLMTEVRAANGPWVAALTELTAFEDKLNASTAADAEKAYSQARMLMLVLGALALAVGVGAALAISRSITQPIGQALQAAKTVAAGDLSTSLASTAQDETGQLLAALGEMSANLRRIVTEVRLSTDSIVTGSDEIASGNADLSRRTEAQAASLEQTASSMEELTSTVKQNSDSARAATQLAGSASAAAAAGGQVVGQVIGTIQHIAHSSKKIADIIGVIDGIAFQTNILALNAAVEAARAGEQGRGFAVVAGEVRTLAQRSADAAKEIKGLITESVTAVDKGTQLVDQAGTSMADIVTQVKRVNDLITEISSASVEQTSGIAQVGTAVTQLDQVTQQNAALVEQASAASVSLRQQATRLNELVGVFKV